MVLAKCTSARTMRKIPGRVKIPAFKFQYFTFLSYLKGTPMNLYENVYPHTYG